MNPSIKVIGPVAALLLALVASERFVVPALAAIWRPPEPIELVVSRVSPEVPKDLRIPDELAKHGLPLVLVAHVDCLGCFVLPPRAVRQSFARKDVLNLVLSSDESAYRSLLVGSPGTRAVFSGAKLAEELHVGFGPRVYAFNKSGRLVYVQNGQAEDLTDIFGLAFSRL